MEVVRVYNNNVAVIQNQEGEEAIAIGRGLAFQKKNGDTLDEQKIEKIFLLKDKNVMTKLEKLVQDMPTVYLTISEEIVEMIHLTSDILLDESIYITLTDHISLSLEREKQHIICENPLLLEIKQLYKQEFSLAKEASKIIRKHLDIQISEEEMGFITLHIVNSSMNQRADSTVKIIEMVRDIMKLVEDYFPRGANAAESAGGSAKVGVISAKVDFAENDAYHIIKGLGGKGNILSVENCFTRLRIEVADEGLLSDDEINKVKNSGIKKRGKNIQIIFGMQVGAIKEQVEEALNKIV